MTSATDQRADINPVLLIFSNRIEAKHDVAHGTVAIGDADRANDTATGKNLDLNSVLVAQREHVDVMSLRIDAIPRTTYGALHFAV